MRNVSAEDRAAPVPQLLQILGGLGLLPFFAFAMAEQFGFIHHTIIAMNLLVIYGAVVLSFAGAQCWGLAVHAGHTQARTLLYCWGVVPPLLAAIALGIPTEFGLMLLWLGFLGQALMDYHLAHHYPGLFPFWLLKLRRALALAILIALGLGLMQI